MDKEFAPSRDRTDEGWIKYDDGYDQQLRRHLYPPEAAEHPAKAPLTQYLDIIEYVSEPGETVTIIPVMLVEMDREVSWCSC